MSKKKYSSRFKYVKSLGVSGENKYAWSFVNEEEKFVVFSAWTDLDVDGKQLIFSDTDSWKFLNGRRQGGHTHSTKHIELILEENYKLYTFPQIPEPREDKTKPAKYKDWKEELSPKELLVEGLYYYAVNMAEVSDLKLNYPERTSNHRRHWEGNQTTQLTTQYERNPEARAVCLKEKGYSCKVCEFDFYETYGELGKNYIHVHHTVRVADRERPYEVDPIKDLVPLCPNCHAMAHKRIPPYSVEELRAIISEATT